MDSEVRTDISPSVLPENLLPIAPEFIIGTNADGAVHDPAFVAAHNTMKTLYELSGSMADAERAVKASNDPQTERRLRAAAEGKLRTAAKAADGALAAIDARSQQVEAGIVETLGIPLARTSVTDSQRASDVRFALRVMGEQERFTEARQCIEAGDVEAVAAILSASPLASGLSREQFGLIRAAAEMKFAGKLVKSRDALGKLRVVVKRADDITRSRFGGLVGDGSSPAAKAEKALRTLEGGAN